MTTIGEQYWRLYQETQALPINTNYRVNLKNLHSRMADLWEILAEEDREEVRKRLLVCRGFDSKYLPQEG